MAPPVTVIALCGLAPAVITETLWALQIGGSTVGIVHIVTTVQGAVLVEKQLLGEAGQIAQLWQAWHFGNQPRVKVHILPGLAGSFPDDRSFNEDPAAMADMLNHLVRSLTENDAPPLHVSIAGGRKTMSAALALVMVLHARTQDQMSHILVNSAYEKDGSFYYPVPNDEKDAGVHLVLVPFPRLRDLLPFESVNGSMMDMIAALQLNLDNKSMVVLDMAARTLRTPWALVPLPPLSCALYALFIICAPSESDGLNARSLDYQLLACLYQQAGASAQKAAILIDRLNKDNPQPWLLEQIAKIRDRLTKVAGQVLASKIGIVTTGRRPHTCYRLTLSSEQVKLEKAYP